MPTPDGADLREKADHNKEFWHLGAVPVTDRLSQYVQGVQRYNAERRCGAALYGQKSICAQPFAFKNAILHACRRCACFVPKSGPGIAASSQLSAACSWRAVACWAQEPAEDGNMSQSVVTNVAGDGIAASCTPFCDPDH